MRIAKKTTLKSLSFVTAGIMLTTGLSACSTTKSSDTKTDQKAENAADAQAEGFTPRLDKDISVNLDMSGFFGNFEALDQVVNDFNEYYPNVTVSYEQNNGDKLVEYIKNNPNVDIFMTDDTNFRYSDWDDYYVLDQCADLAKEDINVSGIQDDYLKMCTFDGKLVRIPMSVNTTGMAVNKTLLEKEGLDVPTNYEEFLSVLEALKKKGYTPIQGSENSVYANLIYDMGMAMIGTDSKLLEALNNGDEEAVTKLTLPFERLQELIDKGYINKDVNADYPADNYDGAILKFFEGDVPFWICTSANFSGMKKRESKSETFSADPFEYEFTYAPLGDTGVYEFSEPWFGFSVNKDSEDYDCAIEFIRFLATEDEMNTIANVKGVPSVAKNPTNERYPQIGNIEHVELSFINDGTIFNHVKDFFGQEAGKLASGEVSSPEDAARDYVERCAEVAKEMATDK